MVIARIVFALLALASVVCFVAYAVTSDKRWRDLGLRIVKWGVLAGLAFFAVLFAERLVDML